VCVVCRKKRRGRRCDVRYACSGTGEGRGKVKCRKVEFDYLSIRDEREGMAKGKIESGN